MTCNLMPKKCPCGRKWMTWTGYATHMWKQHGQYVRTPAQQLASVHTEGRDS